MTVTGQTGTNLLILYCRPGKGHQQDLFMPWLPPGNRRLHSSNRGKYSNLLQRCSSLLGWFHATSVVIDKEGSALAIPTESANDPGFHVPHHRFLFWQWETQIPETTRRMVCRASLGLLRIASTTTTASRKLIHHIPHSMNQFQDPRWTCSRSLCVM